MDNTQRLIGIVGGVGPYAGLDLARKIFDQTLAARDQDHLPVLLLSLPALIGDRTAFLLGEIDTNPAHALFEVISRLEGAGACVVGIPCNTAHAPRILDVVRERMAQANSQVRLVHMIDEVARFVAGQAPGINQVGVLCTTGTARTRVYQDVLSGQGLQALLPDESYQQAVHAAIYDPEYGIKAHASPVTARARQALLAAAAHLESRGAQAVVLGCTEIPLAITEPQVGTLPAVDPTLLLARALIRESYPERLQPL